MHTNGSPFNSFLGGLPALTDPGSEEQQLADSSTTKAVAVIIISLAWQAVRLRKTKIRYILYLTHLHAYIWNCGLDEYNVPEEDNGGGVGGLHQIWSVAILVVKYLQIMAAHVMVYYNIKHINRLFITTPFMPRSFSCSRAHAKRTALVRGRLLGRCSSVILVRRIFR